MYQNNILNTNPQFNPLNGQVSANPNYMFNQPAEPQFNQPINAPNNQFNQPVQQSTNAGTTTINQPNQEDTIIHAFFNMNNMGDTAIVRLLHTSVNTIERAFVHSVTVDGKKKSVKCVGDNCAICATGAYKNNRAYIRLIDYTDGQIKVWVRTDAILSQFSEIEQNWGNLSNCVLKITRIQQEFPKYTVEVMPPHNYPAFDTTDVDKKIAYRFYFSRNADDIRTYVNTGVFPPKQPKADNNQAIPKSQYVGQPQSNGVSAGHQYIAPAFDGDPFVSPQYAQPNPYSTTPNYYGSDSVSNAAESDDLFMSANNNGGFTPIRKVN